MLVFSSTNVASGLLMALVLALLINGGSLILFMCSGYYQTPRHWLHALLFSSEMQYSIQLGKCKRGSLFSKGLTVILSDCADIQLPKDVIEIIKQYHHLVFHVGNRINYKYADMHWILAEIIFYKPADGSLLSVNDKYISYLTETQNRMRIKYEHLEGILIEYQFVSLHFGQTV